MVNLLLKIKNNWKKIVFIVLGVGTAYAFVDFIPPDQVVNVGSPIEDQDLVKQKSKEIASLIKVDKALIKDNIEVEIQEITEVKNGVSFYARAWRNGNLIGFGDGTVEWEHFIFYNPPILVPDAAGTIKRKWTVDKTGQQREKAYRRDPKAALQISLVDAIKSIKPRFDSPDIIAGKRGDTILTFRSAVGSVDPVDGRVQHGRGAWSTIRDAADGSSASPTGTFGNTSINSNASTEWEFTRVAYTFDTSEIPATAVINSATFDIYTANINDGCLDQGVGEEIDLVQHSLASDANVTTADYDQFGTTQGATQLEISTLCGAGLNSFNTFTLNATGRTWIGTGTGGRTRLGTRHDDDVLNTDPASASYNDNVDHYMADRIGTTQDPFLTVDCTGCAIEEGFEDTQIISKLYRKLLEPLINTAYAWTP